MLFRPVMLAAAAVVLASAGAGRAAEDTVAAQQAIGQARELLQGGSVKPALDVLKRARAQWPDHEGVRTELAAAYVADNNQFWALNVLNDFDANHQAACASRAWIAHLHIRQANLELAEEVLDKPGCRVLAQDRAREHLLRAAIARLRGAQAQVREHMEAARGQSAIYEEDASGLRDLDGELHSGRLPWASWRLDGALGWTSNGLAGSPVDRANRPDIEGSAVFLLDSRLRLVWPQVGAVRAAVDGSLRTLQLVSESSRDLSYVAPGIRPGVLFGAEHPRLLLAWSYDAVRLAAIDRYAQGPVWFAEGNRIEYELEATESMLAFGGAGRRVFREQGRSRWEADQGVAWGFALGRAARVLAGGSMRWNRAENEAWSSFGGTLVAQGQVALSHGLEARGNASYSHEHFPRSRGYFSGALNELRVDNLVRAKLGLWSPPWAGARVGLDYEYSHRASTADAFSYTDHRTLLHLSWVLDTDRFGVKVVGREGRTPLGLGVGAGAALSDDVRVRDLMRQDEAVKQGSSCLK
jgi:hypothetical protein